MIKVILILFFVLTFFTCNEKETSYKLWYVSNSQSGNGDGTSWSNARNMKDFTPAWYGSRVQPGDTVFIDGGSSGKTYTWARNGNGEAYATFYWNKSGTADKKIVITRGIDAGHSGTPSIYTYDISGIYAYDVQYVEFSHLKFVSSGLQRTGGDNYNGGLRFYYCDDIDVFYNVFDYSLGFGIQGGGTEANRINSLRIMYNSFYTDTISVGLNAAEQGDAMQIQWPTNIEIAYNTMINRARINGYDGVDVPHRDFMQLSGCGYNTNSITKIHHNFIGSVYPETADIGTDEISAGHIQGLYASPAGGKFYVYDNIFAFYHNEADPVNLGTLGGTKMLGYRSLYMFNNTIVHTMTHNLQGYIFLSYPDTVVYKNNLYYSQQGDIFGFTLGSLDYYDIDYNQYVVPSTSSFEGGLSFSSWKTSVTPNVDTHSEAYTSTDPNRFILVDNDFSNGSESETPSDYALVPTSTGVDEGILVSGYQSIVGSSVLYDYQDSLWANPPDVGAFESSKINRSLLGK